MPLDYMITANWKEKVSAWYNQLEVKITNNTQEDIKSPKISFNISKILKVSGEVRAYTGFEQSTFTAPVIIGKLSGHLSLLKANSSTILTFGFNFSESYSPPLPTNFSFNDNNIITSNDHTPPTPIKDITIVSSSPTRISLKWTESNDLDTGIKGYEVKYNKSKDEIENKVMTTTNSITLGGLIANTIYQFNITAVDNAGNTSESIRYNASTDKAINGSSDWQSGNWIKSSPFVDTTSWPISLIDQWADITGVGGYFLGFITASFDSTDGIYKACWGGNLNLYDGNDEQSYQGDVTVSSYYKSYINNIRAKGKDIILSFGGAANQPIEALITDITKIVDIYLKAIDNYQLTAVDFDFEGSFLGNDIALDRHIEAITEVIKAKPELKISYTLPVDGAPSLMGFNSYGVTFIKKLHDAGITPSLFNCMAMEFGQGSNPNLFECARLSLEGDAANDTDGSKKGAIKQIHEIWENELTIEKIYKKIGLCTMYGKQNNGKVNSVENQKAINKYFVGEKGLGNVNGWDATIDMNPSKGGGGYNPGDYGKVVAAYEPELLGESTNLGCAA